MRIGLVLFSLLFTLFIVNPTPIQAASCTYASTQARVQNTIQTPWSSAISVGCDRTFNVGSFHNDTGQFSNDTSLYVSGPNFGSYYRNGDRVSVPSDGTYTLSVSTPGQEGSNCTQQATVQVQCSQPIPITSPSCQYSSTQARVQKNRDEPWAPSIAVGCERVFNVGSFHNATGQFASDTWMYVTGPSIQGYYSNGNTVKIPDDVPSGTYSLYVATNGQTGPSCSQTAVVNFSCTAPSACTYSSTQARVQRSIEDPWVKDLKVACNETFRVGSFHNGQDRFATDTTFTVTDPFGYTTDKAVNETKVRAFFPGTYKIAVQTHNQSGQACTEEATVVAECSTTPIPTIWQKILQQFMLVDTI